MSADVKVFEDGHGADSQAIKDMLSDVNSQLAKEEDGFLAEQKIKEQVRVSLCINLLRESYFAPPITVC